MQIETLEVRRLLTAAVVDGVLTITGDDANNHIHVRLDAGDSDSIDDDTIVVTERSQTTDTDTDTGAGEEVVITALSRRQQRRLARLAARASRFGSGSLGEATVTEFNVADDGITSIVVNAGAGNDKVSVSRGVTLAATLDGDAGDDKLSAGGGATTVNGGDGNDHIRGGAEADELNGDAGNDTINSVGGGVDNVNGGSDGAADGESGDIAYVDVVRTDDNDTEETADDTTTEPDVVTDVEAVREGAPFGGGGPFFGRGGPFGSRWGGPRGGCGGDDDDTDTDTDTGTDTDIGSETGVTLAARQAGGGFMLRPQSFGGGRSGR
jgi:hypothetical protein